MPTETLSPATRAMLRRAGDALPGSIPAEEEQATMTALAMTGLMIAESDKLSAKDADELVSVLPQGFLRTVPETTHTFPMEAPDEVLRLLGAFLG